MDKLYNDQSENNNEVDPPKPISNKPASADNKQEQPEESLDEDPEVDPDFDEIPDFAKDPSWRKFRKIELEGIIKFKWKDDYYLVIHPHEAAKILKKTVGSAQRDFTALRKEYNIKPRMPLSMELFCKHYGLNMELIRKTLAEDM